MMSKNNPGNKADQACDEASNANLASLDAASLAPLSGLTLPQAQAIHVPQANTPQQQQSLSPFFSALPNASWGRNLMSALLAQQQQQQLQMFHQQALLGTHPSLFNIPSPTASGQPQPITNHAPTARGKRPDLSFPFSLDKSLSYEEDLYGPMLKPSPSQQLQLSPPSWHYSHVMLGVAEDQYYLSELQCILRAEFIEAFGARQADIILSIQGRKKPIALGQVGIQCKYCQQAPSMDRIDHAVTYPDCISSIHNSVQQMFRLHFHYCQFIPSELKEKIDGLKDNNESHEDEQQYWVDSAKRIGLMDTPFGVQFGRNPNEPLPPLKPPRLSRTNSMDEDDGSKSKDGSPVKSEGDGSQNNQEPEYYPLVLPEDKPLITNYLYLALEQMQPTNLQDSDRVGCYKGRRTGFPGLACKHCSGQAGCGRYFPASEASLSQTTTSQTLINHVRNCRRCPIEIREELELMKRVKGNFESKSPDNKPRHGGRKIFFHRLWCRIQRIPLPQYEKLDESPPTKTPDKQISLESPSSSSRKRKKIQHDEMISSSKRNLDTRRDNGSPLNVYISTEFQGSMRLSRGDDHHWLSDACCFIRQELVEAFSTTEEDVDGVNATCLGQVGIRCVYCAQKPVKNRPKGHVYYPSSILGIQDAVCDLKRRHLTLCNSIPISRLTTFRSLKGFEATRDRDVAQYWVDSAKELGLCDYEGGRGEVIFFRNPQDPSPADEVDTEKRNNTPTGSFIVRSEDRNSCTDHIILLLKQYRPCKFEHTDRKSTSKIRDRPVGFPGMMCIHCNYKRYFPITEKKVSDTTNLMMTHITNCFSAPQSVKASLCYLQHRSLIQKSYLMGNWKMTFFKHVWNRLHHEKWDDGPYDDDFLHVKSRSLTKNTRSDAKAGDAYDAQGCARGPSEDDSPSGMLRGATASNTTGLERMRGLIHAAALWLSEQDANAEARARASRDVGTTQTIRPRGSGRGRNGRGRGIRRQLSS